MKNLMILLAVVTVFWAVPAMGQLVQTSPSYSSIFGRQIGQNTTDVRPATAGSSVSEEDEDDPLNLSRLEVAKIFTENDFAISEEEGHIKDLVAKVTVFSRERSPRVRGSAYYRYYYHREPETVVFVSLENTDGDTKIIGSGENTNPQKAAREAAKNAAKKLKKKLGEMKPIILLPLL